MSRRRNRRTVCGLGRDRPLTPVEQAELRDELRLLQAAAERFMTTRCQAESTIELPRRLCEDRRFYTCGRELDHEGPHRWPADTGAIAEWEDHPTAPPNQEGTTPR